MKKDLKNEISELINKPEFKKFKIEFYVSGALYRTIYGNNQPKPHGAMILTGGDTVTLDLGVMTKNKRFDYDSPDEAEKHIQQFLNSGNYAKNNT